jgi:uncharacterized protein
MQNVRAYTQRGLAYTQKPRLGGHTTRKSLLLDSGSWLAFPFCFAPCHQFKHASVMKVFALALLCLPLAVLADGGLPTQPYIYVVGKSEVEKPADMVTMRFDLVARNADQVKANEEVQAKAGKALALLNEAHVAENDVVAQDLRSEPQYEKQEGDSSGNQGELIGYKVTRSFSAKVRDVTAFPKLANELIALGSTEFSGIEAGLSKEKQMQDEVWQKALADARDRADKTLKAMGSRVDSVFAVSPVTFPDIQREIFQSGATPAYAAREAMAKPDASQYRLAPITLSQTIHVIYLISAVK